MIGDLAGALVEALRSAPELALFLLLGTGYLLGNVRLFGFQIGATAGVPCRRDAPGRVLGN